MKTKRFGKCHRCGKCCTTPITHIKMKMDDSINEGTNVTQDCEYLIRHQDGSTSCAIQTTKPSICQEYPKRKEALIYGCGYYFKKISKKK